MDDPTRRQAAGGCYHGIASRTPRSELSTLFENDPPTDPMNRSIHAATARQLVVSGVGDGVSDEPGDIAVKEVDLDTTTASNSEHT